MFEDKSVKIPTISVSSTAGLTSAKQLVDKTGSKIFNFYFQSSTSKTEKILMVFSPSYETYEQEGEK